MIENDYDRVLEQIPFVEPLDVMTLERIKADDKVLEVGTGTGLLTEKIAQKCHQVVSVDPYEDAPSHEAIARRRMREQSNACLLRQDIMELEDDSFDVVVARFTYHHIQDKLPFLQKCYAALKKGGKIVIADEFLPEAQKRIDAVVAFHDYRCQLAKLGMMPIEEGIQEQDLAEDGEYKTSLSDAIRCLQQSGFESVETTRITSEHDVDYELLGYVVVEGRK